MALTVPVAEIVANSKNPLLGRHESWDRVRLGDIADIQNGFPFKSSQFSKDEGTPLIRIRDVGADTTDTNYLGGYDPAFIVEPGDLLVGMDGDFHCSRWRGPKALLNQRVCRVTLKSDIYHPTLLDYALPGYLKAINDVTSSVTVKHLSSRSIAEIPLPLPTMDQQERIVAEIEKQFSRLDEAVSNLNRVEANLKRYKAAVLRAAVEGRLVEAEAELARRQGRTCETGEYLLQRILECRRRQWRGRGRYNEPAAAPAKELPELPKGWAWATLDQLTAQIADVDHKMPHPSEGGIPYISTKDFVGDNRIDFEGAKTISPTDYEALSRKVRPTRDDLLLSRYGTVGQLRVVATDIPFQASYSVAIIKPVPGFSLTSYLAVAMQSDFIQAQIKRDVRATAQPDLGLAHIRRLAIPVPPHDEKKRIVVEVERHLSVIHETEAQLEANHQRSHRMRTALLGHTFSGHLR